jgi:hypothetical protein
MDAIKLAAFKSNYLEAHERHEAMFSPARDTHIPEFMVR